MAGSQLFTAGVAGAIAFSLNGCGGGGGGGGGGTTQAPTPKTTTVPITTTLEFCSTVDDARKVPAGSDSDDGRLVDLLNAQYRGFTEEDPSSPSGVTVRMSDDFSFFYNAPCHQGWPDARLSASLINHKMMMMHDDFRPAVTMGRDAGVVFNQTTVESSIGKCAFMYDGATQGRVNRGCGCAARNVGCGLDGAYGNQECDYTDGGRNIVPGTCHNNTEKSPLVERCRCMTDDRDPATPVPEEATTTSQQCFFKAGGLYPPHPQQSEFHEFVKARIANQETGNPEILPGSGDKRWKQEYWNEVVVDAEELGEMLLDPNQTNTRAVSAFMYIEGHPPGRMKAVEMQKKALADYGLPIIPIVSFDDNIDVRCSGPFREATGLPTTPAPWSGGCAEGYGQCGGIGWDRADCCVDGFVCVADNDYYSDCKEPTTQTEIVA